MPPRRWSKCSIPWIDGFPVPTVTPRADRRVSLVEKAAIGDLGLPTSIRGQGGQAEWYLRPE